MPGKNKTLKSVLLYYWIKHNYRGTVMDIITSLVPKLWICVIDLFYLLLRLVSINFGCSKCETSNVILITFKGGIIMSSVIMKFQEKTI